MKTMTCRQLGGPCDLTHRGDTADDVIKAQDRHLKEAVKAGDATHQEARDAMKGRWRHPRQSMSWYHDVKASFAGLSES
ncbi:DUF1059 domain-containing protein [Tersicoccus sp. Bi-70]|uniref:DUF1059 domain-containing protein n=1 Tax=Tersicoccus sp. Bi-70 TaxID=1897634 RepID=UPI00097578E8|nr:DUF1059 domain-containing protein [Tersicoccus sp. Bi-70]OMH31222.1 hypothetical protein BGP79_09230 [Tersicoccus sp. Bi-70]